MKWPGFLLFFCVVITALLMSCKSEKPPSSSTDPAYVEEIMQWRQKRLERLKAKDGWLSLAGLHWLKEGENTFGADSSNEIIFPKERAADFMGAFILQNGEVSIRVQPGVTVYYQETPVTSSMKIFGKDLAEAPVLAYKSLSWFIIERSSRFAVRVRDAENPAIETLQSIDSYPIDPAWRVEAVLEAYDPPREISIRNITGMNSMEKSPGALIFTLKGKKFRLETVYSDDELFILFTDETSGVETYGAGRYIYVQKPGEDGKVTLDFNKAYNPPCAFTDYATCPLPPEQNHIPLEVTAGEKYSGHL